MKAKKKKRKKKEKEDWLTGYEYGDFFLFGLIFCSIYFFKDEIKAFFGF
jgi:hypothetical protein